MGVIKIGKDFFMNVVATNILLLVYIFVMVFAMTVLMMAYVGRGDNKYDTRIN